MPSVSLSSSGYVSVSEPAPVPARTISRVLASSIVLNGPAAHEMQRLTSRLIAPIQPNLLMS